MARQGEIEAGIPAAGTPGIQPVSLPQQKAEGALAHLELPNRAVQMTVIISASSITAMNSPNRG
jgi:hypothetical protein